MFSAISSSKCLISTALPTQTRTLKILHMDYHQYELQARFHSHPILIPAFLDAESVNSFYLCWIAEPRIIPMPTS